MEHIKAKIRCAVRWNLYLKRRLGQFNPIARRRYRLWWERRTADWARNRARIGHIQFGLPVLYENELCYFFQDSFQQDWEALDALLERPWWGRTWVVQEVWCSSDKTILQCGRRTIKWKTLAKAMCYEEAWDDMGDLMSGTSREARWMELKRRYGLAIHLSQKRLLGSKLSDLLWNTWDREATDPRDKVFAMLGLVSEAAEGAAVMTELSRPDYAKSTAQVYRETARDIIRTEDSLDILVAARASYSGPTDQNLPSWVPDWRRESDESRPTLFVNRERLFTLYISGSMDSVKVNGHGYSACGEEKAAVRFSTSLDTLHTEAVVIDEIELLGDPQESRSVDLETILEGAYSLVRRRPKRRPWWPLNGGERGERERDEIRDVLVAGARGNKTYEEVIQNTMPLRRFFTTSKNKYLCIGPAAAQQGDKIFLLPGCNFPLVLREVVPRDASGRTAFELVGEAYGTYGVVFQLIRSV
ncbi:MAG: HET domain-containing protein, partial [Thaumarchaeota archaeon]|nr:HET domain-containing protein [Nitrososphaerota archaeon]